MERYFREDYEVHSVYDRKVPLNLVISSKGEIITAHKNIINFYSNEFYNLENTIKIKKENIRDILIINDNDDLIIATDNDKLIIYKKNNNSKYFKYKEKIIGKHINFRHIIKLEERNLIYAFSLTNIYIIDIDSFSINFNYSLPENLEIDPRTKPFIISQKKNIICFRAQKSLSFFDYKKMRIIKTIDLRKNAPFQIYKDPNEDFFYLITIVLSEKKKNDSYSKKLISYIEAIKLDLNLNFVEKSKNKINMPFCNEYELDDDYERDKYNYLNYYDHYCIYRCIVQNVKNYSFILHDYNGPPFEAEWFWEVTCKNGKFVKIEQKAYHYLSSDSSYIDFVYIKDKNKIISAFTDKLSDEITFD